MTLIDKDALVAELKKRINDYWRDSENTMGIYPYALEEVIEYVDTLEVKEVDLEKIIEEYFKGWKVNEDLGLVKSDGWSCIVKDLYIVAKHFFELGMTVRNKTQKGE